MVLREAQGQLYLTLQKSPKNSHIFRTAVSVRTKNPTLGVASALEILTVSMFVMFLFFLSFLGSTAQLRPWPPPQNPAEFLGGFSTIFFFTG
jgi:hypothetical protein